MKRLPEHGVVGVTAAVLVILLFLHAFSESVQIARLIWAGIGIIFVTLITSNRKGA